QMATASGAYALFAIGEYREGVAMLDRALELAAGDPTVGAGTTTACPYAYCLMQRAGLLLPLGELEEAERSLERGMKLAREHGDVEVVGWSHMWSVWLAYFKGEAEPALGHAKQALEMAERTGGSFSNAYAWNFLGLAELMRGEWRRASEAFERSLSLAREHRVGIEGEGGILAGLAESYLGLGDAERARELAEQGVAAAYPKGNPFNETDARLALARVLLRSA